MRAVICEFTEPKKQICCHQPPTATLAHIFLALNYGLKVPKQNARVPGLLIGLGTSYPKPEWRKGVGKGLAKKRAHARAKCILHRPSSTLLDLIT